MSLVITGAVASNIGFASHQNAVPVLRELDIINDTDESFEDLELSVYADPPFVEPRSWRVDRINGLSTLHLTDRDLRLNGTLLGDLNESLRGEIRLLLTKNGETLAQGEFPIKLLARAEWGGATAMAELLPAFVMPNDPAVDKLLKATSDVLRRAGKPDGIDGYESGSRTRVWQLVSAMWSAVAGAEISYALPPASFEAQGQKVRTPGAILEGRVATCLDTALLFGALLEQAGLNPLVVLTEGHAFAGVWLQPQEFSTLITDDASAVRKRFDLDELLVFETTMVTKSPVARFDHAVAEARRQIAEENEAKFVMAVDVRRARMQRIAPLAVGRAIEDRPNAAGEVLVSEALLEAPALPDFNVEQTEEAVSPADRIMLWQRKLLDLTTRNRLLHVPDNAKIVGLVCPEPALLEDRLAGGKKIKIAPMPDLESGGRDAKLYQQQTAEDLKEQYARDALDRGEVLSALEKPKLESTLIDLYRKARSDLEEGGANTLFLALGFLKWKKSEEDPKRYRAPLILLPIRLDRKSALSGVALSAHEDEPRFNLTLLELLRHDFELSIAGLDGTLPADHSGIDVPKVWNMVRHAVRDLPGFEVIEDVAIGTFSFAKYLMWRDLVDRQDQLKESPVVRHLIERGADIFPSRGDFPAAEELDRKVDPASLFTPLPADSSQVAAVVASGNGCDFVLDGPPGTGKSQTIANIISHNLALGKRVLFVAEKRAALEVVYRRLEEKGLGEFCLELHSNKASKVDVLKQLERAWDARDTLSEEEWLREAAEVRRLRSELNDLVQLLHAVRPNGLTLHQAIGRVVRDADDATARFEWPSDTVHDASQLFELRDLARRLGLTYSAVVSLPEPFKRIAERNWSNAWQDSIVAAASELPKAIEGLLSAHDRVAVATKISIPGDDMRSSDALRELAELLLATHGQDFRFAFAPDFLGKAEKARRALGVIDNYHSLETQLSVPFTPDAVRRLDLARFEADLEMANSRFWFLATLARKKLARRLAQEAGTVSPPNLDTDLPHLRQLSAMLAEVDSTQPLLAEIPGWNGISTDVAAAEIAVHLAERLRARIASLVRTSEELVTLRRQVAELVLDANDLLAPDGPLDISAADLQAALTRYREALQAFSQLTGKDLSEASFEEQLALAEAIRDNHRKLNAWCNWQRIKQEALPRGLLPLVEAIESSTLPSEAALDLFETAYCRWFAMNLIDAEPKLSQLVTDVHMSDIEAYRRLEDHLAALSVRYVRAKLCGKIPDKNNVSRKDGYGILKHQLQLQRRHKPVRQLATEMGDAFTALAPCMLMSPLSIAQYLPPNQSLFDLVIFDEASQIAPWDAIGSIARGRQVVIAGDPRQMPPTSFFNRAPGATDDDDATEEDMESILDECLAAGVPQHSLQWHYRSRHESLIAFSNNRYYENRLITFPAPETRESAVFWRKVDGVYAKGIGRTNQFEAEALVAETVRRLTDPAFTEAGYTLAIVTLNSDQQRLVEDLLDKARRSNPRIERFFAEDLAEPVVVKNLETVQGDERDLILLGIGYGPTEPGAPSMSMNFGPLNRDGGWRRLNVAITRARRELMLFTSFDASLIDLTRTSARAVRDLKHYIEYAQKGPRALAEAVQGSVGEFESPFEEAVAAALREKGWTVVPQVGVSRFRIDLGVVHPDRPGDFLAGVECDGAAYHSAATARDRDKVRAAILEDLGWKLVRIWSTDWWVDKAGAAERLHLSLVQLLEKSRQVGTADEPPIIFEVNEADAPPHQIQEVQLSDSGQHTAVLQVETPERDSRVFARSVEPTVSPAVSHSYRRSDFSAVDASIDPGRFYEPGYDETLLVLINHVLEQEAPISEALLVQRIARAHGFQRAGRIIHERVMAFAKRHCHVTRDSAGRVFIWQNEQSQRDWCAYRIPSDEPDLRQIEDIALEELRAAATRCVSQDAEIEIARLFGIRRLSSSARQRISSALV